MKPKIYFYTLALVFNGHTLFSQSVDSSFSVKWETLPWGSGGLYPAGPPWNMVGLYDFDNDGYGDFIVSSSYAGSFCNDVYHYEAVGNDSINLRWLYTFTQSVALMTTIQVSRWVYRRRQPRDISFGRHRTYRTRWFICF